MTPQAEALAALHEVVDRLGKPGPLPAVEVIVIQALVLHAIAEMTQVEQIAMLVRPRRARTQVE